MNAKTKTKATPVSLEDLGKETIESVRRHLEGARMRLNAAATALEGETNDEDDIGDENFQYLYGCIDTAAADINMLVAMLDEETERRKAERKKRLDRPTAPMTNAKRPRAVFGRSAKKR